MSTRSTEATEPNGEINDANQVWLDYIGTSYAQAIKRSGNDYAPREYLELRMTRLVALGLDPENKTHWQIETESLSELERIALSMKATGYPDTNRLEADVALANEELVSWLRSLLGQ